METLPGRDGGQDQTKPVVSFHEIEKKWVVGKMNWQSIVLKTGLADDSDWSGIILHLGVHQTSMGPGITVTDAKLPAGAEPVGGSPPPAETPSDLPFGPERH